MRRGRGALSEEEEVHFEKPLNIVLYIPYHSYCPKYILKGFIKGRLISFAINNSHIEDFLNALEFFKARLRNRGYPRKFIRNIFSGVNYEDRESYLSNTPFKVNRGKRTFALFLKCTQGTAECIDFGKIIRNVYYKHEDQVKPL